VRTRVQPATLIPPYGDHLVNVCVPVEERDAVTAYANQLPSLQLSARAVCDLELLATGALSPLDRFMGHTDHQRVVEEMRLSCGMFFPMPVILPVDAQPAFHLDCDIALRDAENRLLAVMTLEEIAPWDRRAVAQCVFGTLDSRHPLVAEMHRWGNLQLSGRLQVLQLPTHYDFQELRLTPVQTRAHLATLGQANVVAFQTRHPMYRVHEEMTKRALAEIRGTLLLQPVVGLTRPGDVDHYTRVRAYRALAARYYDPQCTLLALLPLAMRLAGPREALWHALIHRNYGANYFLVERDHAAPEPEANGAPFYSPYAAQALLQRYSTELGVRMMPYRELVYLPDEARYEEADRVPPGTRTASISSAQIREHYFQQGEKLPSWFTRPEVADILAETCPPRYHQGGCIWLTGLSGAGKSTTAEVLTVLLLEHGRQVTLLDGDVVRTHLSKGLGFSKEDRDTNILRMGFVAAEIVRHGGMVICAAVSPYRATLQDVRTMVGPDHFIEVFVDTPLEICEARDTKGMYARARRGELRHFTGIDDPYEAPEHPDIVLDTIHHTPQDNAQRILHELMQRGFVRRPAASTRTSDGIAGCL